MKLKTNNILIGLTLTIGLSLPYVGVVGELISTQEDVDTIQAKIAELQIQNGKLINNSKNIEDQVTALEVEMKELEVLVTKAIKLEEERKLKEAKEAKAKIVSSQTPVSNSQGKKYVNIVATFYTSLGEENGGYVGINALGGKLKQGSLAVPKDIPLGSKFYIEGYGNFVADDRGGAIKRIDANTIKVDIFVSRNNGESDSAYYKRVNNMGRVKTKGWYIIQ